MPGSPRALRGFLGLTRYYRRSIKNYRKIVRLPLSRIKKHKWLSKSLRKLWFLPLALALFDFFKSFVLEIDISGIEIGAILRQSRQPIAFINKALGSTCQSMSTYEREGFALIYAIKKWSSYPIGHQFIIKISHTPPKHLMEQLLSTLMQQVVRKGNGV